MGIVARGDGQVNVGEETVVEKGRFEDAVDESVG